MKIYTKMGDSGETSLWGKAGEKRSPKDASRVEAYGAVDEVNSAIGLARALGVDSRLDTMLLAIQHRLFALGADLSNINEDRVNRITDDDVARLEAWIDQLDQALPPLKAFILPGGSRQAAQLHMARTIARRAERRLVTFVREDATYGVHLKFLNRLSDFLFQAARTANLAAGQADVLAEF
ncbi:cob(I)yrinic acid a,c-diamide adenosyltransferase [Sulfobacillus harzensis]|uniref:Corrinoid adenosyltransferase n=1 Tax=Sulfobacillus harzensis TaxID=2729629 RepID=A0A7Y0Q2Y6_9FIRM|nr:cob(I)yrinic acid a,c-diamide adenosyltransferase [Sulfobacillus harzensis]NMP22850.1 cob(I)yrinic acid a,c-diamide adenosyltransferase [Sulfobacillus harzensis]